MTTRFRTFLAATALAAAVPTIAGAQTAADGTTTATQTQDDGDHFPWGLLGLLGLAGLIPRKHAVHVDPRTAR